MEHRLLGRSGLKVSEIGLGCMSMSGTYGKSDDATSIAMIGADIARNLARNGIPVEAFDAKDGGRPPGEAMLAEAAAHGADMMVKGAYTHSRLRQMIFGGATSQILSSAEIPVFMAH